MVFTKLIEANTTIPAKQSQVFSTAADNQTSVEIHIQQGERQMSADNKSLGRFHLDGIPPAQRGIPQVEVTFDIDANGILNVSASDKATGKEQSIRIEASSGLSEDEVNKMKRDAEENEKEDLAKREVVDTHNAAEQLIYQTEKQMTEMNDKLTDDDKSPINAALDKLKEANKGADIDRIKQFTEELSQAWSKVSEKVYQQTQEASSENPADSEGSANASEDNIEDADFEVVEDKAK